MLKFLAAGATLSLFFSDLMRALYWEEEKFSLNDRRSGGQRPGRDCCLEDKAHGQQRLLGWSEVASDAVID